jgi:hypothetical protein
MFNDTITTGTTAVTFTKRTSAGTRTIWVPVGDTPANERRLEVGHEVSAAKRVSSLVKVAIVRPHPVTSVAEECSLQCKIVHPASFTEAEVQTVVDQGVKFLIAANVTKIYNQER